MFVIAWTSLILLCLTWGAQLLKRSLLVRLLPYIFFISVAVIFGVLFYWTYSQYVMWQANPVSKFLLPPYQGIGYFVDYVYSRLFASWLIALFAGLLVGWLATFLNRKWSGALFENEEPRLIGLCVFLAGYPGFLLYLLLFSFVYLLYNVLVTLKKKKEESDPSIQLKASERGAVRVPMYYFWLPTAIFAIIVENFVVPVSFWAQFGF